MNCPISVVDVGSTRVAQARNSSIWRGDSRPVPPFRSNRTSASTPPSWNSLTQMRMVESSMNSASAIAAKDQPRSSSRMAFARRETRFSSSPSLAIATRSARSAALRKLRFAFTRRVESIPLIRSTDFRKNEESRYRHTCPNFRFVDIYEPLAKLHFSRSKTESVRERTGIKGRTLFYFARASYVYTLVLWRVLDLANEIFGARILPGLGDVA